MSTVSRSRRCSDEELGHRPAVDRHRVERPGQPHELRRVRVPEALRVLAREGHPLMLQVHHEGKAAVSEGTARSARPTSPGSTPTACGRRWSTRPEPRWKRSDRRGDSVVVTLERTKWSSCAGDPRQESGRRYSHPPSKDDPVYNRLFPSATSTRPEGAPSGSGRSRAPRAAAVRRGLELVMVTPRPCRARGGRRGRARPPRRSRWWLGVVNDARLTLGRGWASPRTPSPR